MPNEYTIKIPANGPLDPETLHCSPGDKIIWKNESGDDVTEFTLPTCVSPPRIKLPLKNGDETGDFTVNKGSKGRYGYSLFVDTLMKKPIGPRNGTIDVS
ncbi:MAG: hypothetical protein SFV54_11800 [Bryobacteraceae bacterium]|nr:hypothetical protein [Bryobacteraceae bacterium]